MATETTPTTTPKAAVAAATKTAAPATTTAPAETAAKTPEEVLADFAGEVQKLTKAKAEDALRFAKEYAPSYAKYAQEAKSPIEDEATIGKRMVAHVKAQVMLRASLYGVQVEQTQLQALFNLFDAVVGKLI